MALAANASARPIFVAIGGDSGSGKSTLTAGFYRIVPEDRSRACASTTTTAWIAGNGSWSAARRSIRGPTNVALMENQLLDLKPGLVIHKPVYDHRDSTSGAPEETPRTYRVGL